MTTRSLARVVVVGNGIAGQTAADALRSGGFDGELTIVGDESRAAYSRPALSKALLRDEADLTAHELPAPDHGATELLGRAATALDADRRLVALDDGSELPYDGLVIACGSRARRLSEASDELVLRTLDDALALRNRIAERPEVVVVGGGPLGMEAASGALEAGCRVTLVTNAPPMARHLGVPLGAVLADAGVSRGLTLVQTTDATVEQRGGRSVVVLENGTVIEGDLVLSAVGDLPNTEWLASSGLSSGGPLAVDSRGRVREGVVAAGDVAAFPHPLGHRRSPLWHSAIEQARVAALAFLRGDDAPELTAQPYFWTEQFGMSVRVAGSTPLAGEPEIVDGESLAGPALLRWRHPDGTGTAVSVDYRIPIPKLRRLCAAPTEQPAPSHAPSIAASTAA